MKEKIFFNKYINNFSKLLNEQLNFTQELIDIRKILLKIKKNKKKVMIFGNGGSASIANHFATDLTKFARVRGVVYNESNLITCLANDYGFENWIKKSIDFYGDKGDCLIIISSSGQSKNIIDAIIFAKKRGIKTILFQGFGNLHKKIMPDYYINLKYKNYGITEDIFQSIMHAISQFIRYEFESKNTIL